MIKNLTLFLLLAIPCVGLNAQGTDWKKYKTDAFSLSYPPGWTMVEQYQETDFTLFPTEDSTATAPRFYLMSIDLLGTPLDEFSDLYEEELKTSTMYPDIRFEGREAGKIKGRNFEEISYTHQAEEGRKRVVLHITVEDDIFYLFFLEGREDAVSPHLRNAALIFQSITMTK